MLAHYFFDLRDGTVTPDKIGTELKSIDLARNHAALAMGSLLAADPAKFWSGDEWEMTVRDAEGLTLFTICIIGRDAAAIRSSSEGST